MKKKRSGLDTALIFVAIFAVLFTATMVYIYIKFQSEPTTLIVSVYTALAGECGATTLIYKLKVRKDEEKEGGTE